MTSHSFDAVIIGGGAAGLSAAQSLGRSLRRTLVIDSGSPRNRFASHMHNVLGHDGVPPEELLARGREEAGRYGVEFVMDSDREIRELEASVDAPLQEPGLVVSLGSGAQITGRALILATGVIDELPDVPGLAEQWGNGVLHCPYCHGWEVRGQQLGVLATSLMGAHQARLVRQLSDRVTVFAEPGVLEESVLRQLSARDVRIVTAPVLAVEGSSSGLSGVRTGDGELFPVAALFAASKMVPRDDVVAGLNLVRTDGPFGSVIEVDPVGRSSHPRVWAIGNVVQPAATVPAVMGAGTFAGAAVNAALVEADFAQAEARRSNDEPVSREVHGVGHHGARSITEVDAVDPVDQAVPTDPFEFWEARYAKSEQIWSGRVNATLASVMTELRAAKILTLGTSLDLGSGEGGDVLWLAEQGWQATGLDLSETAVRRATAEAQVRGLDHANFQTVDLAEWAARLGENSDHDAAAPETRFDLITASFLQSPVDFPRNEILRTAARLLNPGGVLVIIAHAAPPSWAPDHAGVFPSPAEDLAALELDARDLAAGTWLVISAELRERQLVDPEGNPATISDSLVVVQAAAG